MADEHLRALERAASGGDVEAEAKLLLERMRSGELAEERLRIAAYLGDPASQRALGEVPGVPGVEEWLRGLSQVSETDEEATGEKEAEARAGIAMSRLVLRLSRFLWGPPTGENAMSAAVVRESIEALEEWAVSPSNETYEAADSAGSDARAVAEHATYHGSSRILGGYEATMCAGTAALVVDPGPAVSFLIEAGDYATEAIGYTNPDTPATEQIRVAICTELLPWALGTGDPVRDRVEARQREAAGE